MFFTPWHKLPKNKKPACTKTCCNYRPQKVGKHRIRMTIGGDRLTCEGETATPTASIITIKTHVNRTISTPKARCCTFDVKDFYLNTDLTEHVGMWIDLHLMIEEFTEECQLRALEKNENALVEVRKGMRGLKEAGKLAHEDLKAFLKPHGHEPNKHTPGLWRHKNSGLPFTLIVDDL